MKGACSLMFTIAMGGLAFAGPAAGDESGDEASRKGELDPVERLRRLEREVEQLRAENSRRLGLPETMSLEGQEKKEPSESHKPADVEFKATFTDGFRIKSTDGNFELHLGGRWEEEYRYTFNRPTDGGIRSSTNTFYIREAFITMDGTLYHDWGFKINGDFSPPQTQAVGAVPALVSTGAIVEEFWFEWKALKEFRLMFGSFKQPASMEITDSPRFASLIQRSPMARFLPNFDTGIKAYGSFADTALTYELAITNGRSHLINTGRGNPDDNDGKEFSARVTTAPFVQDEESFLKGLRVGAYATLAHEGQNAGTNPTGWPGNLATNELAVTYLALALPATGRFHGDRYRVGGEFTYACGPFMARGEMMQRHDEYVIPAAGKNGLLATTGYYGEGAFVLTGEDRIPNARLVPLHPFSLSDGGWGALEVVARFGDVALDRHTVADVFGVNMAQNSNRVSSVTFGFNWWPVQNVRLSLDYIGENYYQGVQLSTLHHGSHENGVLARFQVDF
jgi:phosphate-selective porin OprO/OprP